MVTSEKQELNRKEAAEILGVHPRTVNRLKESGHLTPSSVTPGGHARYHRAVVTHLRRQMEARR